MLIEKAEAPRGLMQYTLIIILNHTHTQAIYMHHVLQPETSVINRGLTGFRAGYRTSFLRPTRRRPPQKLRLQSSKSTHDLQFIPKLSHDSFRPRALRRPFWISGSRKFRQNFQEVPGGDKFPLKCPKNPKQVRKITGQRKNWQDHVEQKKFTR